MMDERSIAYFSMEIALHPGMPTYAGGLGILAGDTIRTNADLGIPVVGMTLLHRKGYFRQQIGTDGWQREGPDDWPVDKFLEEMPARISIRLEGRTVALRAWRYMVEGVRGGVVPVYFLDANLPGNTDWDRRLTDSLYGGDQKYRLCQEILLGIGGVRMLRALGYHHLRRFHMNEGHSSLLTLELLDEHARQAGRSEFSIEDVDAVRKKCVFTTHTPVPAGHDHFQIGMVREVLGHPEIDRMPKIFCHEGELNLTYAALNLSRYVNGVAKRHGEISRLQYARYEIDSITNGVHAATWTSPFFQDLFDRHIPDWRDDNFSLRYAMSIPGPELWKAHMEAKQKFLAYVEQQAGIAMSTETLTIGCARRATAYKRADLILEDVNRLKRIASAVGPIQIVFAGKAHPRDQQGKEIIHRIREAAGNLHGEVRIAYLENYGMELARLLTSGVDVWLNTPRPPLEASGTSGMKAALNGIPSLSTLDGWWIEGNIEGITGWGIGDLPGAEDASRQNRDGDAFLLYEKLEKVILPTYYHQRAQFIDIMRNAVALNGSFFNTQRMVKQYAVRAYLPP
jgi:glycogen phosphorylase